MIDDRMRELQARVRELAAAREYYAELKAELDQARAIFEAEHTALIVRERYQREQTAASENAVRELAPMVYAAIKEKTVCPGVKIRVGKRLEYDANLADVWSKAYKPELQSLNIKAFEAWADKHRDSWPVFVAEIETVTTAIDKELSSWLPDPVGEKTAEGK